MALIVDEPITRGQGSCADRVGAALAESLIGLADLERGLGDDTGWRLRIRVAAVRDEVRRIAAGLPVRTDSLLGALGLIGFEVAR